MCKDEDSGMEQKNHCRDSAGNSGARFSQQGYVTLVFVAMYTKDFKLRTVVCLPPLFLC